MASATATVDVHPVDHISFRLEYRHDHADGPLFFAGQVAADRLGAGIATSGRQDTLTCGVTAWF